MQLYKDNKYYQACWYEFFNTTPIPQTNDLYIRSIVRAGRHLLRQCKIRSYSYVSIKGNILQEDRVRLHNYFFNIDALRQELIITGATRRYVNQLQYLLDQIKHGMNVLEQKASDEKKIVQLLRIPIVQERLSKKTSCFVQSEFFSTGIPIIYN